MSTRSMIGQQNPDGTITAIYCHWDGYPSNNGKLLVEHYTDPTKIAGLLALGSLSALAPELGHQHPFNGPTDPAHELWCLAYGRDRGEPDTQAETHADLAAYAVAGDGSNAEYLYLFIAGQWVVTACRPAAPHMGAWYTVADVLTNGDAATEIPMPTGEPLALVPPTPIRKPARRRKAARPAPVAPAWPVFTTEFPVYSAPGVFHWQAVAVSIEPGDMIKARYGGFPYNRVDQCILCGKQELPGYLVTRPGSSNEAVWVTDIIGAPDAVLVTLGMEHQARISAELHAQATGTIPVAA
jgi:hypothetical protein